MPRIADEAGTNADQLILDVLTSSPATRITGGRTPAGHE